MRQMVQEKTEKPDPHLDTLVHPNIFQGKKKRYNSQRNECQTDIRFVIGNTGREMEL